MLCGSQRGDEPFLGTGAMQRPVGYDEFRVEFVQSPTKPVDDLGAAGDELIPMVHQQLKLSGGLVMAGHRKVRFAKCRSGHGQSIDGVALAPGPRVSTGLCSQVRGDSHDALAGGQQGALQTTGYVPAVLDGPQPLLGRAWVVFSGPRQQPLVTGVGRGERTLVLLASEFISCDGRVGGSACACPRRAPPWALVLPVVGPTGTCAKRTGWSAHFTADCARSRSYQARPAGRKPAADGTFHNGHPQPRGSATV